MSTSARTLDNLSAEELTIREWRLQQFAGLGFDDATARRLAASADADIARVRALLRVGCPHGLVARIVC